MKRRNFVLFFSIVLACSTYSYFALADSGKGVSEAPPTLVTKGSTPLPEPAVLSGNLTMYQRYKSPDDYAPSLFSTIENVRIFEGGAISCRMTEDPLNVYVGFPFQTGTTYIFMQDGTGIGLRTDLAVQAWKSPVENCRFDESKMNSVSHGTETIPGSFSNTECVRINCDFLFTDNAYPHNFIVGKINLIPPFRH